MNIEIVRQREYGGVRDVLADICAESVRLLADHPALAYADPMLAERGLRVVLGGEDEAEQWDCAPDCESFHALRSGPKDGMISFSNAHEIHVNIDVGAEFIELVSATGEMKLGVLALLSCIPRVWFNALDWAVVARGRTPYEVAVDDGVPAVDGFVGDILGRRAKAAAAGAKSPEDRALSLTAERLLARVEHYIERLETAMQPAAHMLH
jgi:hypothetical protein